jgi:putative spermidine/putrescine transport system substrate-binding protein
MSSTFSRRRVLTLIGASAAVAALLAGCSPSASSSSDSAGSADAGSISINSFGGTFQEAVETEVIAPFEDETGITVDVTTAIGSEALTQLKASDDAFDVAYMDLGIVAQAKAADLLQPLDMDLIPSATELYPLAVDENGYWVAELTSMTGIAYNTEKVTTPPTSWLDLWDEKYAGKVAISNVSGTAGYQFLVEAAILNGGSEKDIDPGFEAIQDLKPNIVAIYNTPDEMSKLLSSGEAWLGPWYADRTSALKASGAPVAFVEPKEGAIAVLSVMVIPKGSTKLDEASKYIDFQISADINKAFVSAIAEGPTNSTVELDDEFLDANYLPYGEDAINDLISLDYDTIGASLSDWVTRWTAEIAN